MVANRLRDAAAVLEVDSAYRRDAAIMREAADEVDRLRHDIERHVEIACELATECERLRAELAECKRDAERYRWVRDGGYFLIEEDRGCGPTWPEAAEVDRLVDEYISAALAKGA